MRNKIELSGKRFGHLLVSEKAYKRGNSWYWWCDCDCGKRVAMLACNIPKNKGCGCQKSAKGSSSPNWKGLGDLGAAFVTKIKVQAQRRGIEWDLHLEDLWDLYCAQNGLCALSGLEIKFPTSSHGISHGEATASLDRIDSSLPYSKSNVQWLHKDVNFMKQQFPESHFIGLCEAITKHQEIIKNG